MTRVETELSFLCKTSRLRDGVLCWFIFGPYGTLNIYQALFVSVHGNGGNTQNDNEKEMWCYCAEGCGWKQKAAGEHVVHSTSGNHQRQWWQRHSRWLFSLLPMLHNPSPNIRWKWAGLGQKWAWQVLTICFAIHSLGTEASQLKVSLSIASDG